MLPNKCWNVGLINGYGQENISCTIKEENSLCLFYNDYIVLKQKDLFSKVSILR